MKFHRTGNHLKTLILALIGTALSLNLGIQAQVVPRCRAGCLGMQVSGRLRLPGGNIFSEDDFTRLLFFACVFGGAFIVEAGLYSLLRKGRVLIVDEMKDPLGRRRAPFDIAGYLIPGLSLMPLVATTLDSAPDLQRSRKAA